MVAPPPPPDPVFEVDKTPAGIAKTLACWFIWTAIIWVTAVPLFLYADKSSALLVVWLIFGACGCLCGGQLLLGAWMIRGDLCRKVPFNEQSYKPPCFRCTGAFTAAGILTYTLGQGSIWWMMTEGKIAQGCRLASDATGFDQRGILILNCVDGYVPTAEQVARTKGDKKKSMTAGDAGSTEYLLKVVVAPVYTDASMSGQPLALAVSAKWTLWGKEPDDVPSPGPECGGWNAGGFCGFHVDFLSAFSGGENFGVRSNWGAAKSPEITELTRESVRAANPTWGSPEVLSQLPIFLANPPHKILSKSKNCFIAGIVLLIFGSSLYALYCYYMAVQWVPPQEKQEHIPMQQIGQVQLEMQ